MTTLSSRLEQNWHAIIGGEFDRSKMEKLEKCLQRLERFLQSEKAAGHKIYPDDAKIFNALNSTPFDDVRVVIIGQDPYHGEGQAHGLCFSVPKGIDIPPSLKNIYKEIDPNKMPSDGDLSGWAKQGVLLLNATLTVRKGRAGSHQGKGWEKFTDAVIRAVNEKPEPVVFLLWGSYAQKKRALIDPQRHRVLEASHPSPFSAHHKSRDGKIHMFHQCGHFREVHKWLIEHNLEPVEWQKI
jgi:uracil-DNA glycosylase